MRRVFVLVVFCSACVPAFGNSFTCPVASLATYEAFDFQCREGKLLFSGFSFSSTSIGSAPQLSPNLITVTPLLYGFQFTAPDVRLLSLFEAGDTNFSCLELNNCQSGTQTNTIAYDVQGPVKAATLWWGDDIFSGSDDISGNNFWNGSETLCSVHVGCTGLAIGAASDSGNPPPQIQNFPVVTLLHVTNDTSLSGEGATYLPEGIFNEFSVPPVPEPATLMLLCAGLLGLMGINKRKNRNTPKSCTAKEH